MQAGKAANYYDLLGVSVEATTQEIRLAFRKLAMQYHPDVNPVPEARELFQQVYIAYDILQDPDRRRSYDLHERDRVHRVHESVFVPTDHRKYGTHRPPPSQNASTDFFERARQQAAQEAYRMSKMDYRQFEGSFAVKFRNRFIVLLMTFLMLVLGFSCIGLSYDYVTVQDFNGHHTAALICGIIGISCLVLSFGIGSELLKTKEGTS